MPPSAPWGPDPNPRASATATATAHGDGVGDAVGVGVGVGGDEHWLRALYTRMGAGDLEALRAVATPQYHLRIPELGVDIAGIDAVLAWLQLRGSQDYRLESVVELRSFVVATVVVDGDDQAELCHVFTRTDAGLAACCVVSGALGS